MRISLIILLIVFYSFEGPAQDRWSFEFHGGVAGNLRLPMKIMQEGYPDIYISKAHFDSEPLVDPYYWCWRFSRWRDGKSWEFETIHHKLFLVNKPTEVQRFGISHGFNMGFFNRGFQLKYFIVRAGLGSVLIHPESTIRNKQYPEGPGFDIKGYRLRGLAVNLAASKQIRIGKYFFVNTEGKITAAYVSAPIVDGKARFANVAFHLILGPGVNWGVRSPNIP